MQSFPLFVQLPDPSDTFQKPIFLTPSRKPLLTTQSRYAPGADFGQRVGVDGYWVIGKGLLEGVRKIGFWNVALESGSCRGRWEGVQSRAKVGMKLRRLGPSN